MGAKNVKTDCVTISENDFKHIRHPQSKANYAFEEVEEKITQLLYTLIVNTHD